MVSNFPRKEERILMKIEQKSKSKIMPKLSKGFLSAILIASLNPATQVAFAASAASENPQAQTQTQAALSADAQDTFTVTFKDADGAVLKTCSVETGSAAQAPENPSKSGYNFIGWSADYSNITADTTVVALYESKVTRLWGSTAIETAAKIADTAFSSTSKSDAAVLACTASFHDAMSSSGLAGALNAPVLLTEKDKLSTAAINKMKELGVKKVYIIGGTAVISEAVEKSISNDLGAEFVRVAGNDAVDTSCACANEIAKVLEDAEKVASSNVIVATPTTFQDAVSMSTYAYKNAAPVLLEAGSWNDSGQRYLTDDQLTLVCEGGFFENARIIAAGGTAAVSDDSIKVARDINNADEFLRLGGKDAYDTSKVIANTLFPNAEKVAIATGEQDGLGLDALAGSVLTNLDSENGVPMLLVGGKSKNYTTIDGYITADKASQMTNAYILGGEAAIPGDTVGKHITDLLGE